MRAKTIRLLTLVFVAAILVALPAGNVLAEEDCQNAIIVNDPGDTGEPGQLRTAIAEVCDGGTVEIERTVTDPIVLYPPITIDKTVTVKGSGQTLVPGSSNRGLFYVASTGNLKLAGVTLGGDMSPWAFRGVEVEGRATLTNVTLTHLMCAVWAHSGSSVTLDGNTLVTGNVVDRLAEGGAGIYNDGGSVTLKDRAAVTGNWNAGCFLAPGIPAGVLTFGGGIFSRGGSITLEDHAVVSGNWVRECDPNRAYYGGRGGGIFSMGGSVTLRDWAQVTGNYARIGGGICCGFQQWPTVVTINDHATITGNTAAEGGNGGGVYNANGVVTLNNHASITGNTAVNSPYSGGLGGGVYNSANGALVINDKATITDNTPDDIYPTE